MDHSGADRDRPRSILERLTRILHEVQDQLADFPRTEIQGRQVESERESQFSPSRQISQIAVNGNLGQDIDFASARPGRGASINLSANLHPTNHLELQLIENQRWLNVDDRSGSSRRLFTARVSRVRGTYSFTARSFARVIAQYVSTERDPTLFAGDIVAHSATFNSSILFAYKLNWQSVLFVGYGDDRELTDASRLEPSARQVFVKISYAIQR